MAAAEAEAEAIIIIPVVLLILAPQAVDSRRGSSVLAGCLNKLSVGRRHVALGGGNHAGDDVPHEGADAQGAVLLALLVTREPLLDGNRLHDAAGLGVVELLGEACSWAVGHCRADGVHDADEARAGVDGDARAVGGHPFCQLLVHVGHLLGVIPAVGGALGKGSRQEGEAAAVAVVGEEGLVGRVARDDGQGREVWRAGVRRVEPEKGLLHGLEGARDWGRAEVDEVCVLDTSRQETQVVDVELPQSRAEGVRRLPSTIRQHAQITERIKLSLWT